MRASREMTRCFVGRLRELAASRRRFGYRRLWVLLRREGWKVNHKRIYRLYCEEGLAVRTKKRRKRPSHLRLVLPPAEGPNERWSDGFRGGSAWRMDASFEMLTVVDHFSRECPLLEAGMSMTGKSVAKALERLSFDHSLPKVITVDNGSEFFSQAMDSWAIPAREYSSSSFGLENQWRTRLSRVSTAGCGTSV